MLALRCRLRGPFLMLGVALLVGVAIAPWLAISGETADPALERRLALSGEADLVPIVVRLTDRAAGSEPAARSRPAFLESAQPVLERLRRARGEGAAERVRGL